MTPPQQPFSTLPDFADEMLVEPWKVDIPDEDIKKMKTLIDLAPIANACYENSKGDRQYGVQRDWLLGMKKRWVEDFDWKKHEAEINTFPHFMADVHDASTSKGPIKIHFVALFSTRKDAIPIILPHGWPGSFLEFLPLLRFIQRQYQSPDALPYHLIVPSLPGFGFSDAPPQQQPVESDGEMFGMQSVARIFDKLMSMIFGSSVKYIAQGGDIGSRIARILAAQFPNCVGAHLNYSPIPSPPKIANDAELPIQPFEQEGLDRYAWFKSNGSAYALMQATKPATLGLVLSSNPLALLAWIGEKFLDWVDPSSNADFDSPESDFAEEILLGASLYWLSGHIASTFYSYRESFSSDPNKPPSSHASTAFHITKPKMFGYSWFPSELAPMPRSWLETTGNLVLFNDHERGGHFAALEQSEALWADVEDFIAIVKSRKVLEHGE